MRANTLKALWDSGQAATNCWLTVPNGYVAETMAHQGWDSATIDMQHGMIGVSAAYEMLTAIATTECVPLVRVPWNEPGVIMKMLDAGAYGIICPMINSREECEQFVGACRYAPDGYRSVGPNPSPHPRLRMRTFSRGTSKQDSTSTRAIITGLLAHTPPSTNV